VDMLLLDVLLKMIHCRCAYYCTATYGIGRERERELDLDLDFELFFFVSWTRLNPHVVSSGDPKNSTGVDSSPTAKRTNCKC
jgi:hypothetical protein